MINLFVELTNNIVGAVSEYGRKALKSSFSKKILSVVVSNINSTVTASKKKLLLSFSNKTLVVGHASNKLVSIAYSNIKVKILLGLNSLGKNNSDILNISMTGIVSVQNYVDNAGYFAQDYVGESRSIT